MFAKIINNEVVEYPFSINKLRDENRSVSFPNNIEVEFGSLIKFNIYRVFPTVKPDFDNISQKISEGIPSFDGNKWNQTWDVVDLTNDEKQLNIDSKLAEVRAERNRLLIESDWTQYKDIADETSILWQPYRQALRDISSQEGFPNSVIWPNKP